MKKKRASKPVVGLNAHLLSLSQSYRSAGISWYIYNLLINLSEQPTHRYTVFLSDSKFKPTQPLAVQRSRWPTHNPIVRILWEQTWLPMALKWQGISLLHALAFAGPIAAPCPYITTIYDLSFVHFPEAFRPFNRFYLNLLTRRSAQKARAVIAISESTRRDIIAAYKISPEKVHTIYCGADASFKVLPQAQIEAFKVRQGLPDKFILRLGTIEPRKNVEGVIKAYSIWRKKDPNAPKLFIAGGKGWYYQQAFQLVQDLGLTDAIIFPGYLPQADLPLWYNAASQFVYPSFFEGFGLPVLEAMACGTPVITSNVSSLPEVAGDAAWLIDPNDTNALSEAMQTIFYQQDLGAEMIKKGLGQAAKFSWKKAARQTEALYRQFLS